MYEIQSMNGAHHCMLNLYLQGFGIREIAEKMGYTPQAVTQVTNSPIFQHELALRRKDSNKVHDEIVAQTVVEARTVLGAHARDAAEKMVETMNGAADERLQYTAAREIIEMSMGHIQPSKEVTVNILSVDRIQLIMQSIEERKAKTVGSADALVDQAA